MGHDQVNIILTNANILIFTVANFHGFCTLIMFAGLNICGFNICLVLYSVKINLTDTIFHDFQSNVKIAKISTPQKLIR